MTNWTKGPWKVYSDDEVFSQAEVTFAGYPVVVVPDSGVAETTYHGQLASKGTRKANANLIAAAPDLYEALEWAMRFVEQVRADSPAPAGGGEDIAYAEAIAALSKARGES